MWLCVAVVVRGSAQLIFQKVQVLRCAEVYGGSHHLRLPSVDRYEFLSSAFTVLESNQGPRVLP